MFHGQGSVSPSWPISGAISYPNKKAIDDWVERIEQTEKEINKVFSEIDEIQKSKRLTIQKDQLNHGIENDLWIIQAKCLKVQTEIKNLTRERNDIVFQKKEQLQLKNDHKNEIGRLQEEISTLKSSNRSSSKSRDRSSDLQSEQSRLNDLDTQISISKKELEIRKRHI